MSRIWPVAPHPFEPHHPRYWLLPLAALLGMLLLTLNGANQTLFLSLNHAAALLPDAFWVNVTDLGSTLVIIAVLLPFARRRPDLAAAALIAALLATLLVQGFKHGFPMPRPPGVLAPDSFHLIGPKLRTGTFPSGHTATAFALAGLVVAFFNDRRVWVPVLLLALLVGVSRIAVGVHWPMDVLAGMTVGWLAGLLGAQLAVRCKTCRSRGAHLGIQAIMLASVLWLLIRHDSGYTGTAPLESGIALVGLATWLFPVTLMRIRVPA